MPGIQFSSVNQFQSVDARNSVQISQFGCSSVDARKSVAAKRCGTAAQWRHSGGTDWPLGGTVAAQSGGTAAQLGGNCATGGTAWRQLCHWRHGGADWRHGGTAWRHGGTAARRHSLAARRGRVAAQWRHNPAARRHNWRHACHWRHRLAARRHGGTAAQWRQSQPCRESGAGISSQRKARALASAPPRRSQRRLPEQLPGGNRRDVMDG
eukprot:gene13745-biopygen7409